MDERDELLREIERQVKWATEPGVGTGKAEDSELSPRVSHSRSPVAIARIAAAIVKARTLRDVKW